jgi:ribosomal protein S18 acetylase RimI-like enzyme
VTIRAARPDDASAVAILHASSWRSAYRGILRDDFLDGALDENRRALWGARLSDGTQEHQLILVDEDAGEIRGFACAFIDADPQWGTLLDNLHVVPELKGQGLGRRLMSAVAAQVQQSASKPMLHLWAYEKNLAARSFYERLGGVATACEEEPALDGTRINVVRYFWDQLSGLAAGADRASGSAEAR